MTRIELKNGLSGGHAVSKYLMGYNIATFNLPVMGMLSDRLVNPKFAGPENPKFGAASDWVGNLFHCRLLPGMGMSPGNAQLIQQAGGSVGQYGCRVYAGEKVEVELWAKVRHGPVTLEVAVKSPITRRPSYASAEIAIDSAYWKQYVVTLDIPVTDVNAGFWLTLLDDGVVFIDQTHLRPVGQPHLDPKAIDAVRSFSPTVLRYSPPALKNGLGPIHLRAAGCDFGIEEYLDLCAGLDVTPQILVDIAGIPEKAAELARYCRGFYESRRLTPPHMFFQMGNEQYAAHEMSHMTGEMYVENLRAFVPPVRAEYPDCSIIGIGYPYSGAYGARGNTPWRELVLDRAADLVDLISNHYYKGQWNETFEDQRCNAVESIGKIRDDLLKMIADIKARNLNTRIAVTEWNYWLHANNGICCNCRTPFDAVDEPMDSHHSLFVAGMIQMMTQLGEHVEISNYYQIMNGLSVVTNFAGYYHETPVAEIFRLYRPAFPGEYVELTKHDDTHSAEAGSVDAMCIKTDTGVYLFVINQNCREEVDVVLPDIFTKCDGEMLVFEGDGNGVEDFPRRETIKSGKFTMPPSSICRWFAEETPCA